MELSTLKTFITVVETGGILSASKALNTVQSNVTNRIKRLEDELAISLFYRQGRGLILAPAGKVLLDYARQMVLLEQNARLAISQTGESAGELRLGVMETFASLRLPKALSCLREEFPQLQLQLETDTSAQLLDQVVNFKLDCAFIGGPVEHKEVDVEEVLLERLVLVKSKQGAVDHNSLIVFKPGCAYRNKALAWYQSQGQGMPNLIELGTLDGILACVAMGLGISLIPGWVVQHSRYVEQLVSEQIDDSFANVPTVFVKHKNSLAPRSIDVLINAVRAQKSETCFKL